MALYIDLPKFDFPVVFGEMVYIIFLSNHPKNKTDKKNVVFFNC